VYTLKRLSYVVRALSLRRRLDRRDRWSRERLERHQRAQLSALVSHSVKRSPFYKKLYSHIDINKHIALQDLPVINKALMMENFDSFVTDPRLKLPELQAHISQMTRSDELYLGEYRVLATSGSTGLKGVFVFNGKEWNTAIAVYMRCGAMMGVKPRFPRWKMASVAAGSPMHVSYRVSVSTDVGLVKVKRLESTMGIKDLVSALNTFQPEGLTGYPSMASLLAVEQIEGRLRIHPRVIGTTGELLTGDMERKIREAWGTIPYNIYGMTEAGVLCGSECSYHRGIHLFEDLFIMEVVDEDNRAVPDGVCGAKLLITNLFNFTQPLIRYEISDMVSMAAGPCPCGRPFRRIAGMEGRSDDMVCLKSVSGAEIAIHPLNFHSPLQAFEEITEYQVIQEQDGIDVFIVLRQGASVDDVVGRVKEKLRENIDSLCARCPELRIRPVQRIERDPQKMGKHKIVKSNIK
jgi:putative adenylate-forming enzyme